ncbi:IclR family transcriptional regulator [Amaricoccus tamworthensis]|uniref:IclR family transcriptional regulator n=1 Tax=Amaricoccus tamworthensis TaxID=57002 RepID=UPI003C7AE8D2
MKDGSDNSGSIPTNLRLLFVLEEMARIGVPVTPTELNQSLNLPKPTIHRLFSTLEQEGFIQREIDGRSYSPGARLRRMSTGILSSLRIRTARVAILTDLAEQVGETVNLALPDRDAMVYIDRVETKWPLRIQLPVGTRVPFYCTASGKMYLSTLNRRHLKSYLEATVFEARTPGTLVSADAVLEEVSRIRERGYSTDDSEFMEGMIAVAVPIYGSEGRLVSTLSFHAPASRLPLRDAEQHVEVLKGAASRLSVLIGGAGDEADDLTQED